MITGSYEKINDSGGLKKVNDYGELKNGKKIPPNGPDKFGPLIRRSGN